MVNIKLDKLIYYLTGTEDLTSAAHILFVKKTDRAHLQLFRYLFVGGLAFVTDAGSLYLLTSEFRLHYLTSTLIGFMIGIAVNYSLSVRWIFQKTSKFKSEITLFTLVGIGGLCLNELIMWVLVSRGHLFYMIAKLISAAVVLVWSFTLRRTLFIRLATS
ncbi:MAG: GtrA family protein [Candidatus Saccharimonadales bacterium]